MPEILVFVDKGVKFNRRLEINWGDGGVSIIKGEEIILRGKDGGTYNVPQSSEHALICQRVVAENGYTIS